MNEEEKRNAGALRTRRITVVVAPSPSSFQLPWKPRAALRITGPRPAKSYCPQYKLGFQVLGVLQIIAIFEFTLIHNQKSGLRFCVLFKPLKRLMRLSGHAYADYERIMHLDEAGFIW